MHWFIRLLGFISKRSFSGVQTGHFTKKFDMPMERHIKCMSLVIRKNESIPFHLRHFGCLVFNLKIDELNNFYSEKSILFLLYKFNVTC